MTKFITFFAYIFYHCATLFLYLREKIEAENVIEATFKSAYGKI